jgi:hypothetical protein
MRRGPSLSCWLLRPRRARADHLGAVAFPWRTAGIERADSRSSGRASPSHSRSCSHTAPCDRLRSTGPPARALASSRARRRAARDVPPSSQGRISTYPSVPWTRIRCPSRISRVAFSTPTPAGKPYSRAITAPWVIRPPTSVTSPVIATNSGVQLGSVKAVTRMSPASRSASAMSRMTRARPSMVPAETGKPTRAPAGTSSRRYAPATASPSDVSTRGGVSA